MKKLKRKGSKALALLLACVMALSTCSSAFATTVENEETIAVETITDETTTAAEAESTESEGETETATEAEKTTEAAEPETSAEEAEEITAEENTKLKSAAADSADEAGADEETEPEVVSIQAVTVPNFYGQRLYQIVITFAEGTDMTEMSDPTYYGVWDRCFTDGTYELAVANEEYTVTVKDTVVTLTFDQGNADNEPFGMLCTASWNYARDYDRTDENYDTAEEFNAQPYNTVVTSGDSYGGYQTRDNLDLVVQIGGAQDDETTGYALTDGYGNKLKDTVWLDTENQVLDEFTLDFLDVAERPENYLQFDGKVPVYYYVPDSYSGSEEMTLVLYVTGNGTSYYEKKGDGFLLAANLGTSITYDNCCASWYDLAQDNDASNDVIIATVDVYSTMAGSKDGVSANVSAGCELGKVAQWFTENYNIGNVIVEGNSNGTSICSEAVRQYPELIDGFIVNNGCIGTVNRSSLTDNLSEDSRGNDMTEYDWTEEEIDAIVENGVAFWVLNGEKDNMADPTYAIKSIYILRERYAEAGYTEEWIADNCRISFYKDWKFAEWGVNNHSCVKVTSWNYVDAPYLDVYQNQEPLEAGATYSMDTDMEFMLDLNSYTFTVYGDSVGEWARTRGSEEGRPAEVETAIDLSTVEAPTHDYTESNQLPLTGYFKASLTGENADREVRYYIPDTAVIRPYYYFIAVPDNVDVDEFLVESGWKQVADETGECLYILVPDQSTGVWGSVEDEMSYMNAAKSYHSSNTAYFTTFGEFYLVGYGAGAAPLEAWAAENPHLIISQAYIDAESCGSDVLTEAGEGFYGYSHMTDGDIRDRDGDGVNERLDEYGNQKILYQMTEILKGVLNADAGENAGLLKKSDMPVPTWLINSSSEDSLTYWKSVNKAETADSIVTSLGSSTVSGSEYDQKEDTWATEYAGQISKVLDLNTSENTTSYEFTRNLRDEMTIYTRYDNTIAYGNGLTYRLDYTEAQVERFTSEDKTGSCEVSGLTLDGEEVKGTVTIQLMETDTEDNYLSDLLIYVPETAPETDIPVIIVWHGGSQTGHLFMDSTAWWQTAAAEGFALAFPTRTNHNQSTSSAYDLPIFDSIYEVLEEDGRFDLTRIYATGQSMGGVATTSMEEYRSEYFAACYATNVGSPTKDEPDSSIPVGLIVGDGNYSLRGIPGYVNDTNYPEDETDTLVRSSEAAAAGADIYWDTNLLPVWESYFEEANGLTDDSLSDEVLYRGASSLNGGTNGVGTLAEWESNTARYRTWYWYNEDEIPIMTYTFALYQAHNCQPGYRALIWDFLEHYSVVRNEDGTVTRYYSESAFEAEDAVVILSETEDTEMTDIDSVETAEIDYSESAQIPLEGWYQKTLDSGRTVKLYFSEYAMCRAYFTVVAVPDGVTDVAAWAEEQGYTELMEERGEVLVILEPGADG